MKWLVLVAGVCMLWGCASSDDDDDDGGTLEGAPLDCAWLANDNCWQPTVNSSVSCLPPTDESGVMSADGRTCTYASGHSVNFTRPLVLPYDFDTSGADDSDFIVRAADDSECLHYVFVESSSRTLTVRGQTYAEKYSGFDMQVTCPNGEKFAGSAINLLSCENFFTDAPSHIFFGSGDSLSFGFGIGGNSVQAWSCHK